MRYIFTIVLLLLFGFSVNCKDPARHPEDDVTEPPEPPVLIHPQADTSYNGDAVQVLFDWNYLAGAQIYEIQIDTLLSFNTGSVHSAEVPPKIIELYRYAYITTYYCRIRAASELWTYYTDWSETRRFYLKPEG
jgi:hypothetical protein